MKRKFWNFDELEQRRMAIKTVIDLRKNQNKTFREIASELNMSPVQICDIWDTNKNNPQLEYLYLQP